MVYHQTERSISLDSTDAAPVAARIMRRQMGTFAMEALDSLPLSERCMSGLTLSLIKNAYERINQEIAEFRKKIVAFATEEDCMENVYRLNLHLFPLARLESLNGEFRGGDLEMDDELDVELKNDEQK